MSDTEHPISAHVDEYVKMLQWSDTATQDVKTIVIGNLRGFAAYLAAIESQADILAHTRKGDGPTLTNEQVDAFLTQHKDDPVDTAQLERVRARFNEKLAAPSTSEAIRGAAEEIALTYVRPSVLSTSDNAWERAVDQIAAILSRWFGKGEASSATLAHASWKCPKCGWRKTQAVACAQCHAWCEVVTAPSTQALECFCGTELEAGLCPNGHDPEKLVDEVQHRMDQVVEAAVEWHQAGREGAEWFDAAGKLGAAIDSLLELRDKPAAPASPSPAEPPGFRNTKEAMEYARRNNIPAVIPVSAAGGDEDEERFRECNEGRAQTIANRERYEDRERCKAARSDGECEWSECPQLRDGEPAKTGRHCPIDTWPDED